MNRIKTLYAALAAFVLGTVEQAFDRLTVYMVNTGAIIPLNIYSQRTYDAALLLKAAGLVGASADGSLILDVGTGLLKADLVLDVTALEIDTTDESYTVILEGSPDAAFGTAGNIVPLAKITIGHHSSTAGVLQAQGPDDAVGRYLVPVRNERNGTTYRYLRIRTVVAGTIGSGGINFMAWLAKDES